VGERRPVAVEDRQARRERVRGIELADESTAAVGNLGVVVAPARQAGSRFEHQHLEIVLVAEEHDVGRKIQALGEYFHPIAGRDDDVLAVSGVEVDGFDGDAVRVETDRIGYVGGDRSGRKSGSPDKQRDRGRAS